MIGRGLDHDAPRCFEIALATKAVEAMSTSGYHDPLYSGTRMTSGTITSKMNPPVAHMMWDCAIPGLSALRFKMAVTVDDRKDDAHCTRTSDATQ